MLLISVKGLAGQTDLPETKERSRTLVIGKITRNPKKIYHYLKPMVDYMAENMADLGITGGRVLMAKNNQAMIHYILSGKVDWITETAYSALELEKEANAEILLQKWKKGVPAYHAIFITRKNNGVKHLSDLNGKMIAFEDADSNTAFFLPVIEMLSQGMKLKRMKDYRESPPENGVGYIFSNSEINSSFWVERGYVSAAAISNLDWNKDDHLKKSVKENLTIFHKTKDIPRALELVRSDLDEKVKQRLKEVLLGIHKDPGAKQVLAAYQKTKQFDELDQQNREILNELRSHFDLIEDFCQ